MKKLLTIILCLAMLCSCLIGCTSGEAAPFDLSEYTIIVPESAGELLQQANILSTLINEHLGVKLSVKKDTEVSANSKAKEILLGQTNRSESTDALKAVKNSGFVVKNSGNKLIIAGTNNAISSDGVQYFIKHFLLGHMSDKTILMNKNLDVVKSYESVKLVEDGKSKFAIVYDGDLDDNFGRPMVPDVNYDNGGIDYEVQLAYDLKEKLEELTGVEVEVKTDDQPATGPEILIGKTNRMAYYKVAAKIGSVQYGVGYMDGSIVVAGHSTEAVALACKYFNNMLNLSKETLTLELGEASLRLQSNWATAFPAYDGGVFRGTSESCYDELQHYYTDTNEEEYKAYCQKLEANGFTLEASNEIEGKLISNTYKSSKTVVHVYYAHAEKATRIFAGKLSKVEYSDAKTEEYEKVTDIQITQIQLDYATNSGGMGYIITLEDGSFVLIDSGSTGANGKVNKDHVRIWNLLNTLNKRKDGKIIIRAWFITHAHADHIGVYKQFCTTYGTKVKIEEYYECIVPESVGYNSKGIGKSVGKGNALHTGMKFDIYGIEVEVLYTVEDIYPKKMHYFNDASSVFKITANGTTFMILGDLCDTGSDIVSNRYGNYLKSDIVQVAHHTNIGATSELYDFIDPVVALAPTSDSIYNQLSTGKGNQRHYEVNYKLFHEMNVKEIYTNSGYSVVLTITEDGYVLGTAKKLAIGTNKMY